MCHLDTLLPCIYMGRRLISTGLRFVCLDTIPLRLRALTVRCCRAIRYTRLLQGY